MQSHSNENEFDLHENSRASETHFHMNCFARRLILTQGQKVTQELSIFTIRSVSLEFFVDFMGLWLCIGKNN